MRRNETQTGERTSPHVAESEIDIFFVYLYCYKGIELKHYVIRLSDNTYQIIINATILAFVGAFTILG